MYFLSTYQVLLLYLIQVPCMRRTAPLWSLQSNDVMVECDDVNLVVGCLIQMSE